MKPFVSAPFASRGRTLRELNRVPDAGPDLRYLTLDSWVRSLCFMSLLPGIPIQLISRFSRFLVIAVWDDGTTPHRPVPHVPCPADSASSDYPELEGRGSLWRRDDPNERLVRFGEVQESNWRPFRRVSARLDPRFLIGGLTMCCSLIPDGTTSSLWIGRTRKPTRMKSA